ncbi:MAG TPA: hypothetical protein VFC31_11710 [Candidatus Limnocylindria bacterium]|nr:hypothetical protein [Candidatus Limnocylindria bacterium]
MTEIRRAGRRGIGRRLATSVIGRAGDRGSRVIRLHVECAEMEMERPCRT